MARESADRIRLLKKILHIASGQQRLLSENRLSELAGSILERDEIIKRITKAPVVMEKREQEQAVIQEILAFDGNLRVSMEGALWETQQELEKILHCSRAHRAYATTPVNKKSQRYSQNG